MRVGPALPWIMVAILVWGVVAGFRQPEAGCWAGAGEPAGGPPASPEEGENAGGFIDPLGPNAACYVCHMTFVREPISRVHLAERIGCIRCHGISAGHANDENIGATPPDIVFARRQVDSSCGKCHKTHDVPAREVVARFLERRLPRTPAAVCTDCHGRHRIDRAAVRLR